MIVKSTRQLYVKCLSRSPRMEPQSSRRKVSTYGKGGRRVLVHDIFDVAGNEQLNEKPSVEHRDTNVIRTGSSPSVRLKHEDNDRITPYRNVEYDSGFTSPTNDSPGEVTTPNSNIFEFNSSEDDRHDQRKQNIHSKRRKMAPRHVALPVLEKTTDNTVRTPATITPPTQSLSSRKMSPAKKTVLESKGLFSQAERAGNNTRIKTVSKPVVKKQLKAAVELEHPDPTSNDSNKATQKIFGRKEQGISEFSDHSSTQSLNSPPSRSTTPKRKRNIASKASSPGQLELKSLRLTSEKGPKTFKYIPSDESETEEYPPRKGRGRLVDRLDAPSALVKPDDLDTYGMQEDRFHQGTVIGQQDAIASVPQRSDMDTTQPITATGEQHHSPQRAKGMGKPKATYGRQRSHLTDMASSSQPSDDPLSQSSSQDVLLQVQPYAGLQSQLEFDDDDSDEQPAGGQIKSIHELRQAGVNNRSDRDLDALVDDITAGAKALRLQALIQLVKKLQDQQLRQRFLESSRLQRLSAFATAHMDVPSCCIFAIALHLLVPEEQASAKATVLIYRSILDLAVPMIEESRSFETVVADRKENLSKAVIRDLLSFEKHVIDNHMLRVQQTKHVIPSNLTIEILQSSLHKVVKLREHIPESPKSVFKGMLTNLAKLTTEVEDSPGSEELIEFIQLALSWFELSSAGPDIWATGMTLEYFSNLGMILTQIMNWAKSISTRIEHTSLRLLVSLSNNDSKICKAFASTPALDSVFTVIDEHFVSLAECAAQELELDRPKLDSVILALGCLLNFADCDSNSRSMLLTPDTNNSSKADRLITIFNRYVDETSEVTCSVMHIELMLTLLQAVTLDQTQVLVAFGYLSMLLCTLCLDASIRDHVAANIKGHQLDELFAASETFMSHIRAVETIPEEGGSASTFTSRFSTILETVRLEEAN